MLGAVEFDKLFQVVWVSLVAGVGVSVVYSVVIYSASRALEAHRDHNETLAAVMGVVSVASLIAFLGGVVWGVSIMLTK